MSDRQITFPWIEAPEGVPRHTNAVANAIHLFGHGVGKCVDPYDHEESFAVALLLHMGIRLWVNQVLARLEASKAEVETLTDAVFGGASSGKDHDHREHPDHDHYRWDDDGNPHHDE